MEQMYTYNHSKQNKREHVRLVLTNVWSYLENHLQLANTHGADFISRQHWDTFVPKQAQHQLLAMTREELVNLIQHDMGTSQSCTKSSDQCGNSSTNNTQDNQEWLPLFITGAYKCHLENTATLSTMSDVINSRECLKENNEVISEAMSEKKIHEIKAISEAVVALFRCSNADVVVDVGSGKGYLGCELARHHQLPVLGLDSSDTNTRGASQRDGKLARRWKGLARRKERQMNIPHDLEGHSLDGSSQQCCVDGQGPVPSLPSSYLEEVSESQKKSHLTLCENCSVVGDQTSDPSGPPDGCCLGFSDMSLGNLGQHLSCQDVDSSSNSHVIDSAEPGHGCLVTRSTETGVCLVDGRDRGRCEPDHSRLKHVGQGLTAVPGMAGQHVCLKGSTKTNTDHRLGKEASSGAATPPSLPLYVPVTKAVHPGMNLRQILEEHAVHLSLESPACSSILMTGLHACGSLSVTVMELFLEDPAAVGLCFVGCCYQLMEESHVAYELSSASSAHHFPLSGCGKQLNIHLGRNARNLASQSVARVQASGQLQGTDFLWRAMLDVLLHELGCPVPDRILGMRGIQKRSRSFQEYVQAACHKLRLSPDLVSPEFVTSIEIKCDGYRDKMAAFFQLKLVLAPVIETLILLDRFLYLLEQESVQDAHIIRLFDPVTSPRCYAIMALKARDVALQVKDVALQVRDVVQLG